MQSAPKILRFHLQNLLIYSWRTNVRDTISK